MMQLRTHHHWTKMEAAATGMTITYGQNPAAFSNPTAKQNLTAVLELRLVCLPHLALLPSCCLASAQATRGRWSTAAGAQGTRCSRGPRPGTHTPAETGATHLVICAEHLQQVICMP
jgi:hypothetical protein